MGTHRNKKYTAKLERNDVFMNIYETRELEVALAKILSENGWKIYGLYEDRSDLMTDYYEPEAWEGIAEKNGFILAFNNRHTQNLDGKMVDNTQTKFGETDETKMVFYPKYQKNPEGSKWHIEKDGEIVAKGRNIGQMYTWNIDRKINGKFVRNEHYNFIERDEKAITNIKKFIEKIEKVVSSNTKEKEEVVEMTKEVKNQAKKIVGVEGRQEVQVGDLLHLSGLFYQVMDIDNGVLYMAKTGAQRNGFKPSQAISQQKVVNQAPIVAAIKADQMRIYQVVDAKEDEKLPTVEEAIQRDMKKMEQAIDEVIKNQEKQESAEVQENEAENAEDRGVEKIMEELEVIQDEDVRKELVGSWIWVSGETYKHRDLLKKLGFKWASKKKMWYYSEKPSQKRWGRKEYQMDEIKQKYGSRSL